MSNFVDIVSNAVAVVGGSDADYRVQAAMVTLLIVTGIGYAVVTNIIKKRKTK